MSEERLLLIFAGEEAGWLRLADGAVIARGAEIAAIPPLEEEGAPERVVLVVPGADVAVHWAEIPPHLSSAQAIGAARIMASEVSAQPLGEMHVAIGPPVEDEEERGIALVNAALIADWLARAQALGFDPDHVVPEPLLLLPPEEGVALFQRAGLDNIRSHRRAFAAESALTALLIGDQAVETVDAERFERDLPLALATLAVDLRQGAFAKRRRWQVDWLLVRRLATLGVAILVVTLLIQLTMLTRYSFAADALELRLANRARDVLRVEAITDAPAQLRDAVAAAGGGPSYSALAGPVFTAVRETGESEVQSLIYGADGSLRIAVSVPGQAELDALLQRLEGAGLAVAIGPVRDGGGRRIGEFTVSAP